jgi:hypothetical protein
MVFWFQSGFALHLLGLGLKVNQSAKKADLDDFRKISR